RRIRRIASRASRRPRRRSRRSPFPLPASLRALNRWTWTERPAQMSEPSGKDRSFETALSAAADDVAQMLDRLLPRPEGPEGRLAEAMRYAALGGGKRFRPFLVCQSASLFGVAAESALRAAAAAECVHIYSLVHDDLPAMDDDDLRHGAPSAHREYDEATAILAGDALL